MAQYNVTLTSVLEGRSL
jgi:hypothetical protein